MTLKLMFLKTGDKYPATLVDEHELKTRGRLVEAVVNTPEQSRAVFEQAIAAISDVDIMGPYLEDVSTTVYVCYHHCVSVCLCVMSVLLSVCLCVMSVLLCVCVCV